MRCEEARVELPALLSEELELAQAGALREHLQSCAACAEVLDELRSTIALLHDAPLQDRPEADLERKVFDLAALEEVGSLVSSAPLEIEPPEDLEVRALVRAGVLDSIIDSRSSRWSKVSMVLVPGLAAAAVVVGFVATRWHARIDELEDSFGPMGRHVASQQLTSFDESKRATADLFDSSHANYHLVIHTQSLPETPPGYHYEAWLTGARGTVSAGSFHVRGPEDTVFSFMVGVRPSDYPHVEISLEPDDGDPAPNGATVVEANFNLP